MSEETKQKARSLIATIEAWREKHSPLTDLQDYVSMKTTVDAQKILLKEELLEMGIVVRSRGE